MTIKASQITASSISGSLISGGNIGAPVSGFSPTQLAGLSLWYDISDLTTLFQDAAGTTPVTADGDPVGRINDKSGNSFYCSQSTASARPTYKTDGTYHWLLFDGGDFLDISNNLWSGAIDSDNTLIAGAQITATGIRGIIGVSGYDGVNLLASGASVANFYVKTTGSAINPIGTTNILNTNRVISADRQRSSGDAKVWQNQNLESSLSVTGADKLSGASFLGKANTGLWAGNIYNIAVYDVQLSTTDRNSVESYIADKSGVTL